MNAIKIYGENNINSQDDIVVSSGDLVKANLYDQKRATKWQSAGSNDTTAETITITFKNKSGLPVLKSIDRIILLNTNVLSMSAAYIDGTGSHAISEATITDNAETDFVIEMAAPVSALQLVITLNTTIAANAEKYIGELKACLNVAELNVLSSFDSAPESKQGNFRLNSGELHVWKEYERPGGTLSLENISKTQRDLIKAAIADYDFLTVVMHDDFDAGEIYEFAVVEPAQENLDRKTQFYSMSLELKGK